MLGEVLCCGLSLSSSRCVDLFSFFIFHVHVANRVLVLNFIVALLGKLSEAEALVARHILVWILYVEAARLTYHVEVLSGMKNLLFVFCQEDRYHFFPVCESIDPVLVIEISFDVFLLASSVFLYDEFVERILKDTTEYPLLQYLEVRE